LKLGKLQLPSLSVRNKNYKDLVMELDYKNAAESLLVVSELNKIIHSF
jgi:trafficking protein particle complex subunit 10